MKKPSVSTILLILVFLTGLSLLLYPTVANYVNTRTQSRIVDTYTGQVINLEEELYKQILADAHDYNTQLLTKRSLYSMTQENLEDYHSQLNPAGNGLMGTIQIPRIDVELPIYHTVEESVLHVGVGHIEWSSLPVGGESTHAVLSGHRGLPSAKLFSDLDQMQLGDTFSIQILEETLTYEVDQILVVNPEDVDELTILEGQDLCTLVTCTPYGINSHRLLVRGHRVWEQTRTEEHRVTADAVIIEPIIMVPLVAAPMLVLLLVWLLFVLPKKKL